MFAFKKVLATVVGLAALSIPSLALADNHAPRDARDRSAVEHRVERRPDFRRDRHDRWQRDRWEHGRRDWRDHCRGR